jgi:hypothetical protein
VFFVILDLSINPSNMENNYWAVLVSAVASMVIGSIWFGPLFGKQFMQASGMDKWTPEQRAEATKAMMNSYLIQVVASLLMFYVLAHFISGMDAMTTTGGMTAAFWIWLGFVVPVKIGDAIWGGSWKLSTLTAGNMLVTLLAAGAILGSWK